MITNPRYCVASGGEVWGYYVTAIAASNEAQALSATHVGRDFRVCTVGLLCRNGTFVTTMSQETTPPSDMSQEKPDGDK